MASTIPPPAHRLQVIAQARQQALCDGLSPASGLLQPWIARSWQRCLSLGLSPQKSVHFGAVSAALARLTSDANRELVTAARPVLERLCRATRDSGYFAILTNHLGVVVDANGPIDRNDRRADLITRIGTDLSEASVGTTAIGAALSELAPVWLHRGEHFFDDTSVYSCAGAPLFGPKGDCVGMLDLTGVQVAERPELRHLVVQAARSIENLLTQSQPHALMLRLNWPGHTLGGDSDGLLLVDADGAIVGANSASRQLLPELAQEGESNRHCRDLFAMATEQLFSAAGRESQSLEVPLWSGIRLQLQARGRNTGSTPCADALLQPRMDSAAQAKLPLKALQAAHIRQAVQDARGNVAQAARALGVSRATVYRKLQVVTPGD